MPAVAERVALLDALDVEGLDRAGVQAALVSLTMVRGWHDALHGRLTRRLNGLAADAPSIFPEADLAAATKTSRRAAGRASRRAATLGSAPELEQALSNGECTSEHVDALGRALQRLTTEQRALLAGDITRLTEIARRTSPEEFERVLRREVARLSPDEAGDRAARQRRAARFRSWTDRDTGMVCFRGELDPETGLKVISRIETAVETMYHRSTPEDCPEGDAKQDFLRATALTRLVLRRKHRNNNNGTDAATGDTAPDDTAPEDTAPEDTAPEDTAPEDTATEDTAPEDIAADETAADQSEIDVLDNRCEMIVVIDLQTLLHGLHANSIIDNGHDIDLPLESYRRMACQAAIIPIVLDSNGVAVDIGREVRLANRAQRRALRAMYDTCAVPGCRVRSRHCEPHHIRWWRHWGRTDLNNLLPLCSKHHHAVHEGGWQLLMHPDRSLTITYPDGTTVTSPPPKRRPTAA